jgi:hypothetical protein
MKKILALVAFLFLGAHANAQPFSPDYSTGWVKPRSGTNWLQLQDTVQVDARSFASVFCNGTADDAPGLNAGLATLTNGGTVTLPGNCAFGSTVNIPSGVKVTGGQFYKTPALKPLAANVTLFNLSGNGAALENVNIDATGKVYTSGFLITVPNTVSNTYINYVQINGGWSGISVQGVTNTVANVTITGSGLGTGAVGFLIPNGVNVFLFNDFVHGPASGTQPEAAVKITGGGGHILYNVQGTYVGNGLEIMPSGGPVDWVWCDTCVMDNDSGDGFHIVASGASSYIAGAYFVNSWAGTNTGYGAYVEQDTSGTVNDVHFSTLRSMGNGQDGVYIAASNNVYVQNSSICGNSAAAAHTYNGITALLSATNAVIENNLIGDCGHFSSANQNFGVSTAATKLIVQGNTFNSGNNGGTINIGTAPTNGMITNNLGIDDVTLTVASAASISVGVSNTISLTGTAAVSTITPAWQGRKITIVPTGASSVTTGGNIANAVSFAANVPHVATFSGTTWFVQ